MLIESFSNIQGHIEYVTNSKTEMEMSASLYYKYFKALIFQFITETFEKIKFGKNIICHRHGGWTKRRTSKY